MPNQPESLNPYTSPDCEIAPFGDAVPAWPRYISFLFISGILLSLPPIPLFLWLAENEPFLSTTRPSDLALVGIAGLVAMLWMLWAAVLIIGMTQRWVVRSAAWYLLVPCIAGWISFYVVYDFGCDQGWFG